MPCRVKICGITNLSDALAAIEAGADALGFVFYEPSPRYITPEACAEIVRLLPPYVSLVGLFVNEQAAKIIDVFKQCRLDIVQFHGDETPEFCEAIALPYYRALRVDSQRHSPDDVLGMAAPYVSSKGVLLDTYTPGVHGGTGQRFDWSLVPDTLPYVILAGGLDPSNVSDAIDAVKPYAVDVSGGVELSKGKKCTEKMRQFIDAVKQSCGLGYNSENYE